MKGLYVRPVVDINRLTICSSILMASGTPTPQPDKTNLITTANPLANGYID